MIFVWLLLTIVLAFGIYIVDFYDDIKETVEQTLSKNHAYAVESWSRWPRA